MTLSLNEKLCHAQHSQLLVIDIQERLASAMPEKVLDKVVHGTSVLLNAAKELGIPVIRSEQYPQGLGSTLESVAEHLPEETHEISKTCFSCVASEGFSELVAKQKRKQVIICGIESHICVLQTAIQLQAQGYHVYVVEDAVCSRKKLNHRNAMARLRANGINVSNMESVLFEWLRDASHPQFKTLSKLVK